MKHKIAIAGTILIRNHEEGLATLATINELSKLQIPIIIVDGGSAEEFQNDVKKIENTIYEKALYDTFSSQLIQAQQKAAELAENIFFLQLDKLDFVKKYAQLLIEKFIKLEEKSILIASRTEENLKIFPPFQIQQERFINQFLGDYIGKYNDYVAGPKIYPSEIIPYLHEIKTEIGWGVESFMYVIAKRLGVNFYFEDVYFDPPADIGTIDELKLYRLKITKWELEGFLLAAHVEIK